MRALIGVALIAFAAGGAVRGEDPSADVGEIRIAKIGDSVVDAAALTIRGGFGQCINGLSFQQDAVTTHRGYQYVGYYDGKRRVCLARRQLPNGAWQVIRFEDYHFKSNDAHNTISVGICPRDGTVHLAFDHHGHDLHYRVSRPRVATQPSGVEWSASLFGGITSALEKGRRIRITYPRFWQTPDGSLQFGYRQGGSGNGDRMLVDYDAATGSWRNTRQIDSRAGRFQDSVGASDSRCSYPNGYDYGPHGKLHVTWVWRESSQGANHDLMYAYSEDGGITWRNNRGEPLTAPPGVASPHVKVVEIPRTLGLMNTHGQAVDSQGRVHAVVWHCTEASLRAVGSKPGAERWGPPEARRYHHYWRDKHAQWQHVELPLVVGSRPKLFFDSQDCAYLICCDAWRPRGAPRMGQLTIAVATAAARWKDWRIVHVEPGPFTGEMLGDLARWKSEGVLSVMAQQSPGSHHESTRLRILDFSARRG